MRVAATNETETSDRRVEPAHGTTEDSVLDAEEASVEAGAKTMDAAVETVIGSKHLSSICASCIYLCDTLK